MANNTNSAQHNQLIAIFEPLGKADPASWSSVRVAISRALENLASTASFESAAIVLQSDSAYEVLATLGLSDQSVEAIIEQTRNQSSQEAKDQTEPGFPGITMWRAKMEKKKQAILVEMPNQLGKVLALFIVVDRFDRNLDLFQAFLSHVAKTLDISRFVREQEDARKLLEQANADLKAMQDSLLNIMDDLQTRNKYLSYINSLSKDMASCSTMPDLIKVASQAMSEMLDGAEVAILLVDQSKKNLILQSDTKDPGHALPIFELGNDEIRACIPGSVETLNPDGNRLHKELAEYTGAISGLLVPLVSKREPLGLIMVAEKRWHRVFSEDEKDNIASVASMLAVCIDNITLMQSLTKHIDEISNLNEYISTVVDSVDIAIMVVDKDFKITMFNSGFQKLYGYDPKEFIGKNVFEAFPHLLEQGFGEVVQTIRSGKSFVRENWRRKIRDGREAIQNIQIVPHRNASGEIIGAITLLTDITEKVKLEDQLDKSEAKFRRLVEELDDAYFVVCDGTIAYANNAASAITGLPIHQLLGSKPQRILIDKDLVTVLEGCPSQKIRCESKVLHTSGIVVPVEASIYPSDYGERKAVSVVLRDITERKKIENQLAEKNREMRLRNEQITRLNEELEATVNRLKESQQSLLQSERIAAITETAIAMNHEINAPLFAILGQAQLLLRKCGEDNPELIKRLRIIEESALRIACVTKKLANMADPLIQKQSSAEAEAIPSISDL